MRTPIIALVLAGLAFVTAAQDGKTYRKPDEATLKQKLTPQQYAVTQKNETERPFRNEYWDHKAEGIYVDVVTGQPLFSSRDKFDSGTGWPSFSKPIEGSAISTRKDRTDFDVLGERTEVRSSAGDSHLGHVFDDGPASKGGQRYCINSASLRFVPVAEMEKQGYGHWLHLFKSPKPKN